MYGYFAREMGQLRKLTDPFGKETNYVNDKVGRLTDVTGTTFASQSTTIDNKTYRAFGGTKSITYGTNLVMTQTFDNRLRPASFDLTRSGTTTLHKEYEYLPDSSLKYSEDGGGSGNQFDRLYIRDFAGRLTDAKSGAEARGETPSPAGNRPYLQSFEYDAFNNVTELNSETWDQGQGWAPTHTFDTATNRETTTSGIVMPLPKYYYDADGRQLGAFDWGGFRGKDTDASGRVVGQVVGPQTIYPESGPNYTETYYNFYIRSTVLGGALINEIHLKLALDPYSSGVNTTLFGEQKTHVQADGQTVATQRKASQEYDSMTWEHFDPSGASYAVSAIVEGNFYGTRTGELDATGSNAGTAAPEPYDPWNPWIFPGLGSTVDNRCIVDGIPGGASLDRCMSWLAGGSAIPRSLERYQHLRGFRFEYSGSGMFTANIPTGYTFGETRIPITAQVTFGFDWNVSGKFLIDDLTPPDEKAREIFNDAANKADELLKKQKCIDYLKNVLGLSDEEIGKITSSARGATLQFARTGAIVGEGVTNAAATSDNRLILYNGFFTTVAARVSIGGSPGWSANEGAPKPMRRSKESQAQLVIHEGIHLVNFSKYSDAYLANMVIANDPKEKGKKQFAEGDADKNAASEFWGEKLRNNCK